MRTATGAAPAALDDGGWLFNSDAYHGHNGVADAVLRVVHEAGGATGVVHDGTWTCGYRAPYGGFDLARRTRSFAAVAGLVDAVLLDLSARGIGRAVVRCRPLAYGHGERATVHALLDRGFGVERAHANHHIAVGGTEAYLAGLSASARNMVRRGLDLGLEVAEATTPEAWAAGHAVLAANKAAKGRTMHLGLDYLLGLRALAPIPIRLVTLALPGAVPCAAALTYRVHPEVELVVAWGDAGHDLPRSPMNLLALRLVERAAAEGVRLLDLGISSDETGALNPGLAFFKESVGANADLRFDLALDLP